MRLWSSWGGRCRLTCEGSLGPTGVLCGGERIQSVFAGEGGRSVFERASKEGLERGVGGGMIVTLIRQCDDASVYMSRRGPGD